MNENKHTPGPWNAKEDSERFISIQSSGVPIAEICLPVLVSTEEINANARLIAAAPELLEALELMLKPAIKCLEANGVTKTNNGVTLTYSVKQIENYRAAIAKARGES